jgi:aminoglycoside phosphotransferase family enzyme/predicted kinase
VADPSKLFAGVSLSQSPKTEQDAVIAFLAGPGSHGGKPVQCLETHISQVFLAGDKAYKLKKAVKLDFLDFSTLDLRHKACLRELELNRRLSPDLYLGVEPITRSGDGFVIGGDGPAVDWVVVMRRFSQNDLFDQLARDGKLTPDLIARLADKVAELHDTIEVRSDLGGADAMTSTIRNAFEALEKARDFGLKLQAEEDLCDRLLAEVRKQADLLEKRRQAGMVRYCHGDMHLANICLHDGEPTLFDAIEFDDTIACVDVLYDIAFPIMDLVSFDKSALANQLLNRYLETSTDYSGVALLPLFLSARAAIRAMALGMAAGGPGTDKAKRAKRYFEFSRAFLDTAAPRLIAVGGLSGTGKSVLARGLAPKIGSPPGAVMLRSDGIRKRLFGKHQEDRLPQEAYSGDVSARVYSTLVNQARDCLAQGASVIADATFLREADRKALEAVADETATPFTGIWLEAPLATLTSRVDARSADASDATAAVVKHQTAEDTGTISWHRLRADRPAEAVLAEAMRCIAPIAKD